MSGDMNVFEMLEELGEDDRSFESDYNTAGGWAMEMLGHIPEAGEQYGYRDLVVTVSEVEGAADPRCASSGSRPSRRSLAPARGGGRTKRKTNNIVQLRGRGADEYEGFFKGQAGRGEGRIVHPHPRERASQHPAGGAAREGARRHREQRPAGRARLLRRHGRGGRQARAA
ncbi:MAG: transporter associated domain-containing protein [Anaerotruncus massiliensis (ex Togo et al. 2019)]